jgi:hypothetical protein
MGSRGESGWPRLRHPMKPPRTPEEQLRRVLRTAQLNGLGVAIVAGLGALVSLAFGDLLGAAVGALVAVGGGMEIGRASCRERV